MKVFVDSTLPYYSVLQYTWGIFASNQKIQFSFTENRSEADFIISEEPESDIRLAKEFYNQLLAGQYDYKNFFKKDCLVLNADGSPDYLATAFYMINSVQEYGSTNTDEIGRFPYTSSYQFQFGNITENLVQQYFDKLKNSHTKLAASRKEEAKAKIFLSHDLDSINGAFMQDGMAALKQGNIPALFQMLLNVVILKPDWLNMDKIMKMESEYDAKSTFFWLVNKGNINARMANSDYNINNPSVRKTINHIKQKGWENGLHKSISKDSYAEEIAKLGTQPIANRNHYLRITLPDFYNEIEQAGLKFDSSLGFAEHYGFRNSYGLPFRPYNIKTNKAYPFIEVPLHLMDGTFQRYMKIPAGKTADDAIHFIEKNKANTVLSVLWHNTFFTNYKYKGFPGAYKKLLTYFYDNKMECLTASQIVEQYYH